MAVDGLDLTVSEGGVFGFLGPNGAGKSTTLKILAGFLGATSGRARIDGYDASLRTAYNFGFLNSRPDWVETYPYQNGLLVSYWNEQYADNKLIRPRAEYIGPRNVPYVPIDER